MRAFLFPPTQHVLRSLTGAFLLALTSLQSSAITYTTPFTISLTITQPTCTVNNNQAITVNFGDVNNLQMTGDYKKTQIPLTIQCSLLNSTALQLRIEGTGAAFNTNLLETSIDALGVALWVNNLNTSLALNSDFNFTTTTVPRLYVSPVLQSGVHPTGGEFSAAAVLRVGYE